MPISAFFRLTPVLHALDSRSVCCVRPSVQTQWQPVMPRPCDTREAAVLITWCVNTRLLLLLLENGVQCNLLPRPLCKKSAWQCILLSFQRIPQAAVHHESCRDCIRARDASIMVLPLRVFAGQRPSIRLLIHCEDARATQLLCERNV